MGPVGTAFAPQGSLLLRCDEGTGNPSPGGARARISAHRSKRGADDQRFLTGDSRRIRAANMEPPFGNVGQPRNPRMVDVARLAGVSHQTVSRVLNGNP